MFCGYNQATGGSGVPGVPGVPGTAGRCRDTPLAADSADFAPVNKAGGVLPVLPEARKRLRELERWRVGDPAVGMSGSGISPVVGSKERLWGFSPPLCCPGAVSAFLVDFSFPSSTAGLPQGQGHSWHRHQQPGTATAPPAPSPHDV